MADNWQLEAVQKQFDVFDELSERPYIATENISEVVKTIEALNVKHKQNKSNVKPPNEICNEIIKSSKDVVVKFSYIVLVTNQEIDGSLSKFLVFTVVNTNTTIFIDSNCSVYHTWNAFLKNNSLSVCEFCFPVDGQYNVGGKLMIDFTKSPATINQAKRLWNFTAGCFVACGVVAASFFFRIPPTVFRFLRQLLPIAEQFLPGATQNLGDVIDLSRLVQELRNGQLSLLDFMQSAFRILERLHTAFQVDISGACLNVLSSLRAAFHYVWRKLLSIYESASDVSRQVFLAVVCRVDESMRRLGLRSEQRLNDVMDNASSKDGESSLISPENTEGRSIQGGVTLLQSSNNIHQMFKNCKIECALQTGLVKKESSLASQPFDSTTQDLLTISKNIADHLKCDSLNYVQNIFESLSSTLEEEFTNKIDVYQKAVQAARSAAGHSIDIQKFNGELGITGHPKDHFWKEAIESIAGRLYIKFLIEKKVKELQMQKKTFMIPLWNQSENDVEGLYRITGIQTGGIFSVQEFIAVVREKIYLNENNLVVNETFSQIFIRSPEYIILLKQEENEENTSEGLVFIKRHTNTV